MEKNIVIVYETESVCLLSGEFFDGDSFVMAEDEVVFLTVLPLDARFLPYTVKLVGGTVASNSDLALMVKITGSMYALKLGKRHFVHAKGHISLPDDFCGRFFYLAKGGHSELAFEMLSPELRKIGDKAVTRFFDGFSDIIEFGGDYYLVDEGGVGHKCVFSLVGGKIDNISVE